jgi:hypothetical protein
LVLGAAAPVDITPAEIHGGVVDDLGFLVGKQVLVASVRGEEDSGHGEFLSKDEKDCKGFRDQRRDSSWDPSGVLDDFAVLWVLDLSSRRRPPLKFARVDMRSDALL